MPIHEGLKARRDEVIERWRAQVQGALAPDATSHVELIDHIPQFVDEIVAALRADLGLSTADPSPDESTTASGHGAQRLRLGFSLDAVVREYGALTNAIVGAARDHGELPTFAELEVLFDCTITGIADAVSEYTRQRDAELHRQANEHFAFIAHELRDPLASASMAVHLLKSKGELPENNRSALALERGLRRASDLIDKTLQTARVASGIELHRQSTTLADLFGDVALGAASEAESKGVEIRTTIGNDEHLSLDVRLVRSALGNLVRNSVKYTSSGSVVHLRANVANGRAVFEIEDCCGGLPPGKVEQAFAPFVRFDDSEGGFGLGLAIARQAADAHGGNIRVQNLPGKGCVFVLELPVGTGDV